MMDLHCHTTASDGQYSPEKVVAFAKEIGISVLAITDHDTIDGLARGEQAAKAAGIRFIPGIEINAQGTNVHVLGYNIAYKNRAAQDICMANKKLRIKRAEMILAYLANKKVYLTWADLEKYTSGGIIARPHFARAMVAHGYVNTVSEAFTKYLDTKEFRAIRRPRPTAEEAVKMIRTMHGIPVLAHPALQKKSDEALESLLVQLKSVGLLGIECYHSEHSADDVQKCLSLAAKYNLLITGGSDFHGEKIKPTIKLGTGINNNLNFHDEALIYQLMQNKYS